MYHRALARKPKWYVFQIPYEMQRGLDLLHPDYTKERNERERCQSLVVWCHSAAKRKWR